jgi:type IV pilus assembly protein PilW
MAGYTGCGSATKTTNILLEAGAWDNGYPGVFGYESKDVPESFTKHVTGQDALVVRRADGDERAKVVAHRTSLAVFKVEKINIIDRGSIMLIADSSCQGVGMFRGEINHSLGEVSYGLSLGNCTDNLSFGGDCRNFPEELGQPYTVGSTIMPMVIRAYYISKNSQGVPSLYMKPVFADGSSVKQELVEGVEGMQITYGADENVDGAVDVYKKADEIMDWQGVKSVRIELLIRSINAVGEGSVDYIFNSESYSDRYVRQIASSTIMLRNR